MHNDSRTRHTTITSAGGRHHNNFGGGAIYSRQMSNIRAQLGASSSLNTGRDSAMSRQTSGTRFNGRGSVQGALQNSGARYAGSDAKSLVRVALKNQRRGEKIAGSIGL